MEFQPERFLAKDGKDLPPDPRSFCFGFGRRVCPGRNLAENSLFLTIVQSLAVFSINKPTEDGKEVEPEVKFSPGVVSHPQPFKTSITPRSPHHEKLIRSIETTFPWAEGDGSVLEDMKL